MAAEAEPTIYGFAFSLPAYCDRRLVLEIVAANGSSSSGSNGGSVSEHRDEAAGSALASGSTSCKQACGDLVTTEAALGSDLSTPDNTHRQKRPRLDDNPAEPAEEEVSDHKGTPILRVERVPFCGVLLAGQSRFFRKLLDEASGFPVIQSDVKVRVTEEEVESVKELVYFSFTGQFRTEDPIKLIPLLGVCDQYEAWAALHRCIDILEKFTWTEEIAIIYLEYPFSDNLLGLLQPIRSSASSYFAERFKNILHSTEDLMALPLSAIKAVFRSSLIAVPSEDFVLDFLLKWVSHQYPEFSERKHVFNSSLLPLVKFVHLSCMKLRTLVACNLITERQVVAIISALLFKADTACRYHPCFSLGTAEKSSPCSVEGYRSISGDTRGGAPYS